MASKRGGLPEGFVLPPGARVLEINRSVLPDDIAPVVGKAAAHKIKPERGRMNGTEKKYADEQLEYELRGGLILRYDFEEEGLRLADRTFYYPDFRVVMADQSIEFREVKGFWEDDALAKFKACAERHPYVFVAIRLVRGQWVEDFRI